MSFSDVFKSIKDFLLNQNGIEIKETDYDSLLVKQLSGSNILGEKGKQTHIAITGESMEMFPYIYSKEFIELNNKEMKNFWHNFYIKGLGEFFYRNQINPTGLAQFLCTENRQEDIRSALEYSAEKVLILFG